MEGAFPKRTIFHAERKKKEMCSPDITTWFQVFQPFSCLPHQKDSELRACLQPCGKDTLESKASQTLLGRKTWLPTHLVHGQTGDGSFTEIL